MKLREIAEFLGLEYEGEDLEISAPNSLLRASFTELTYCDGEKNTKDIPNTGAAAIIVAKEYENLAPKDTKVLVSPNSHLSFAFLNKIFAKPLFSEVKTQNIAKSTKIMPNIYLGNNINIGENVVIMASAFVGDNVSIGDEGVIHPNVVIYNDTKIGKKCHLLANYAIGSDGFGHTHNKNGGHYKIYHNGNVILEDFVETGTCTTIDRAVFGSTIIKAGTKVDDLVRVGHNYQIGQNCIIVAQTGISDSGELGRNVVVGGQSATSGHFKISDFSTITARGGVSKSLEGGRVYGGFPIMLQRDRLKIQAEIALKFREKD